MGPRWTWWARTRAAILVAGLFLGSRGVATGKSTTLVWDRNAEEDLAGYKVYIGTFPGNYTQTIDVGHATSVTIPDLLPGETYFIAVTAYDIFANESGHSAEIRATIPKAPPPAPEPAPATTLATPEPALPGPPREAKTPELPGIIHPNPSASQAASGGSSSASAGSSATGEGGSPTLMSRLLDSVRSVFGFGGGERTSPSASSAPPPAGPAESRSASEAPTQPVASASPVASQAASRAGGLTSETIAALRLRGAREREVEADRLHQNGRQLYQQGRFQEAIPWLRQAEDSLQGLPASEQVAFIAHDLGVAYYAVGRYREAIQAYERAIGVSRGLAGRELQASVLDHIGMAYNALGDYTAAGSRYQSSLKIWEELGKLEETAAVLARLGTVQAGAGRYADALSSYQRSLALTRELGNHERLRELQDAIATVQRLAPR